ncbi:MULTISPECIES: hypothetical protein [Halocynthiibacter]|uniref:Uncharacterized protein n=1 Tax=Halocynthiibacter halioticoli TaxID=2986804 RepID=A0AAE3LS60_9RHOB|nr:MULTISPECIES: hypothetical protein [Halocynthiibacter]MCV6825209.1 hypothetical protein [Halocynthiibacter halioticoli]MCW4058210.1 hypothetical protein [Halocynthiibacter sp. SDUM655004]
MKIVSVDSYADDVAALLTKQLSVKGKSLEKRIKRSGRLLPGYVRKDAQYIVESQKLSQHPKLARMLDEKKLAKSHKTCVSYLKSVNPSERRKGLFMSILGSVSFAIFVSGALFIAFLVWRDLV